MGLEKKSLANVTCPAADCASLMERRVSCFVPSLSKLTSLSMAERLCKAARKTLIRSHGIS